MPYAGSPAFVLGFHGCDHELAENIFAGRVKDLKSSDNDYDWLGSGSYFWENDPRRALDWANTMKGKPRRSGPTIQKPAVIGAIINLGRCLDFLSQSAMALAKDRYGKLIEECEAIGKEVPRNVNPPWQVDSPDRIYRRLDRAVVESIHQMVSNAKGMAEFESVRAVFLEGRPLYPDAGFLERTHIQICVRKPELILGYFRPRGVSN